MPPNSDAVDCATGIAPAARSRATWVLSSSVIASQNTSYACVAGHPATASSSLTAMGTPPNGRSTSHDAAAAIAASPSTCETALSSDASIAASEAATTSDGASVPARYASTSEQASPCQ